jgi:hypothetical protein
MSASGGTTSTGGSGGSGGGGPATPGERFLFDYAAAVCGMYEPCCNEDGHGFDLAGCTSWFSRVRDAYLNGDYDPEQGEACLSAVAAAHAADADHCGNVAIFDEATFWNTCKEAFTLTREGVGLGEVCMLAGDCSSHPDGPVTCYGGRCLLQLEGGDGDGPCFIQGSENRPSQIYTCNAADGVYCDRGTNACTAHAPPGERCPYSNACDPSTALCSGGMCYALPAEGEPCLNGIQGAGGFCEPGSVCDFATVICGPGLPEGAACKEGQCESGVCVDGVCKRSDYDQTLNCTG